MGVDMSDSNPKGRTDPRPSPSGETNPLNPNPLDPTTGTQESSFDNNLAQLLDQVQWEYDSADDEVSPLTTTGKFFDEFPWDG